MYKNEYLCETQLMPMKLTNYLNIKILKHKFYDLLLDMNESIEYQN